MKKNKVSDDESSGESIASSNPPAKRKNAKSPEVLVYEFWEAVRKNCGF